MITGAMHSLFVLSSVNTWLKGRPAGTIRLVVSTEHITPTGFQPSSKETLLCFLLCTGRSFSSSINSKYLARPSYVGFRKGFPTPTPLARLAASAKCKQLERFSWCCYSARRMGINFRSMHVLSPPSG